MPPKAPQIALQLPVYPNSSPDHRACNSLTPLPLSSRRLSVSTGGFGLRPTIFGLDAVYPNKLAKVIGAAAVAVLLRRVFAETEVLP